MAKQTPIDTSTFTPTGTYGEGAAAQAVEQLKQLRASLDAGSITVSDFVKQGQPLAEFALEQYQRIAPGGRKAAGTVGYIVDALRSGKGLYGFSLNDATGTIQPKLPQEYQLKLRDEILPTNISAEERQALIDQIPEDIDLLSDEGRIVREGIRQSLQQKKVADQQKQERSSSLRDLASFLAGEEERKFNLARPEIAEEANATGYYSGTGYSEALAKEKAKLAGNTSALLAAQGLSDRSEDISALAKILGTQQEFASEGLRRRFGMEDQTMGFNRARALAELTRPQEQKRSGLDTAAQIAQIASGAAGVGRLFMGRG